MSQIPPITNLLAFETVARRRSFALAAAELHLTASAVSHQISKLEIQLGVRLLERSAHGVRCRAALQLVAEQQGDQRPHVRLADGHGGHADLDDAYQRQFDGFVTHSVRPLLASVHRGVAIHVAPILE